MTLLRQHPMIGTCQEGGQCTKRKAGSYRKVMWRSIWRNRQTFRPLPIRGYITDCATENRIRCMYRPNALSSGW
jgi:hypothetical protein